MTPADKFLSRVDHRQTGPGRWQFRVPTRKDRRMSGSAREADDGRLLLHDFGGDSVVDILAAVDLSLTDLFPSALTHHGKPQSRPFAAVEALRAVARDCLIVCAAAAILRENKPLLVTDFAAMIAAAGRVGEAVSTVLPEFRRTRHEH
jgi:hypothetical protein